MLALHQSVHYSRAGTGQSKNKACDEVISTSSLIMIIIGKRKEVFSLHSFLLYGQITIGFGNAFGNSLLPRNKQLVPCEVEISLPKALFHHGEQQAPRKKKKACTVFEILFEFLVQEKYFGYSGWLRRRK
ncbi:hypothetical protein CEXT_601181 [Caerostris extrusa]|uniref:Uncharacterized protein n=1 Tax=Caerostris extrusa TaxID=172846 RepID=A0AAV4RLI7_CAEEX|nr:hypothetical protein CEXT_601181 [Caerostris extrusa]